MRSRVGWAAGWLLCMACAPFSVLNAAQAGTKDGKERAAAITPLIDYHQHLASPAEALLWNGVRLPAVELPSHLRTLLDHRGAWVGDRHALSELYTEDSLIFNSWSPGVRWIRGRAGVTGFVGAAWPTPHRLVAQEFRSDGSQGFIAGYYASLEGPADKPEGYFQIAVEKGDDGRWRIAAESPMFPGSARVQEAITAHKLIAMLDEAGIRRAVVLSDAFIFGGRSDMEFDGVAAPHQRVREVNDWTAQQVAQYPDRLVGFFSFSPLADYALAELDRCAEDGRLRGLKLHLGESKVDLQNAAHVAKLRTVFAAANRHRLPIIVHVSNNEDPRTARANVETLLHEVVSAAPDVVVQIAHLWGGQAFSAEALDAYADAVARKDPAARNLYFDVAELVFVTHLQGIQAQALPKIAAAIRRIGLERVLYGSDGALEGHDTPARGWERFRSEVPLTEAEFLTIARNVAPYMSR